MPIREWLTFDATSTKGDAVTFLAVVSLQRFENLIRPST